jgi:NAD(P)-dependent dehydrogenase (short-subunit alcohol dehydrogenase family)
MHGNILMGFDSVNLAGINLEFAKLCQKHGCRVLAADIRSTPELEEWLREVQGAQPQVVYQQTDVAQWVQLKDLITTSEREFGEVPDM